jgi:hypothetical protein
MIFDILNNFKYQDNYSKRKSNNLGGTYYLTNGDQLYLLYGLSAYARLRQRHMKVVSVKTDSVSLMATAALFQVLTSATEGPH